MDNVRLKNSTVKSRDLHEPVVLDPIASNKGYGYHVLEIATIDFTRPHPIIEQCVALEHESWNPQEDFLDYIAKRDLLAYVTFKGRVVGFLVITVWLNGDYGVVSFDEAMISKDQRGNGLALKLVWFLCHLLVVRFLGDRSIKRAVLLGLTVSPVAIQATYRYRRIFRNNSFRPNEQLTDIAWQYLKKYDYEALDPSSPWFVKAAFPGSSKWKPKLRKGRDRAIVPANFDCHDRGDAFLFMGGASRRFGTVVTTVRAIPWFGWGIMKGYDFTVPLRRVESASLISERD